MKLFKPEIFQGNLKKNRYFEGWYFKHVSANREHVFSFIPGISLNPKNKHAFIQFINGRNSQTAYVNYPLSDFQYSESDFEIWIGDSYFSGNGIKLRIDDDKFSAEGEIGYSNIVKYPSTLISPGIMGWYSYVPLMECKHGIGSVLHNLSGSLNLNDEEYNLADGKGYIEKDWGTSFPESWIWLHCNTFEEPDCSFTFSVAKIPWLGSFFIGHICFLYVKGKFYLFATYNKSEITQLNFHNEMLEIELRRKNYVLKIKAVQQQAGKLTAPETGEMNRIIKESVDSKIEVVLSKKNGEAIFSSKGERAGMEIIEKILEYFDN